MLPPPRLANCRFLFLDFDGVLHPGLSGSFNRIKLLEQFLRDHPLVMVVLSTTWRLERSLDELRSLFQPDLRERVIDVTPALPDGTRQQRHAEICAWLTRHRMPVFGRHWAALDDEALLFPQFCDQLVLCNPARGLLLAQIDELTRKLC